MKKTFLFGIAFLFSLAVLYAQDDKSGPVSGDAVKSAPSRGGDENVEFGKRKNSVDGDVDTKSVQPFNKGARARGGAVCLVNFDNWTDWYIDCYVDGYLEGYIAPYGDGSVSVGAGDTRAYAVAEFNDGSKISWGPTTRYCYNDVMEMTIYDDYYNISVE